LKALVEKAKAVATEHGSKSVHLNNMEITSGKEKIHCTINLTQKDMELFADPEIPKERLSATLEAAEQVADELGLATVHYRMQQRGYKTKTPASANQTNIPKGWTITKRSEVTTRGPPINT
jgi:hypothetical protein